MPTLPVPVSPAPGLLTGNLRAQGPDEAGLVAGLKGIAAPLILIAVTATCSAVALVQPSSPQAARARATVARRVQLVQARNTLTHHCQHTNITSFCVVLGCSALKRAQEHLLVLRCCLDPRETFSGR